MASSTNISRVPVKNIYYMLVYAWKHPYEKNLISIYDEDEKDLVNLLCKVLIVKVKSLIKRGFYTEYFVKEEESGIIRGKILFKESLQKLSHKRAKMYISEEEMSVNNLHNQLIKSSLHLLLNMLGFYGVVPFILMLFIIVYGLYLFKKIDNLNFRLFFILFIVINTFEGIIGASEYSYFQLLFFLHFGFLIKNSNYLNTT